MMTIQTAYGPKRIIRRVGEYYFEAPCLNAPHGGWWTLNGQPVSSNNRALRDIVSHYTRKLVEPRSITRA